MKLGKKTKRGLLLLGGLLLLFVLAHTPPAKSMARWGFVRVASSVIGGSASVEFLDYRLWRGEFVLSGVSLQTATEPGFVLSADRIRATVSPTLRLSAEVEAPDLTLVNVLSGSSDGGGTASLSWIRRLRINDGVVRLQRRDDTGVTRELLTIEAITAAVVEDGEQHRIDLQADRTLGRMDSSEVALDALDVDLILGVDRLHLVSASLFRDDSYVRAEGELDLSGEATGAIDLQYALDGSLARLIDEEISISGIVSGNARADFDDGNITIDADLGSPAIGWGAVTVTALDAAVSFAQDSLRIDRASATAFGGEVQLGGEVSLHEAGAQRLELSWNGIDAVDAVQQIAGETLPATARVGGTARLEWTGQDLGAASGEALVRLEPGAEIAGTVRADLENGRVRLETDDLSVPSWGTTLSASGDVDPSNRELQAEYVLRVADVGALPTTLPVSIAGPLTATGRVGGSFDAPEWTATVGGDALSLNGEPLALSADLMGSLEHAVLNHVRLEAAGGVVTAEGTVPLDPTQRLEVTATLADIEMDSALLEALDLVPVDLPIEARIDADVEISGRADDPDLSAEVRVPRLSVDGASGSASFRLARRGHEIEVRELGGSFAGGAFEGEATYSMDRGAVTGNLALLGLQLGRLPWPGEYSSDLEGSVDAELAVTGTLERPEGHAQLVAAGVTHNGIALPAAVLDLEAADGGVSIEGATQDGRRFLTGELGLDEEYPLHVELDLDAAPLREWMASTFAAFEAYQDDWTLQGSAALDAKLTALDHLVYTANIESAEMRLVDRTIRASPFRIEGSTRSVHIENLEMTSEGALLVVDATLPLVDDESIDLRARGRVDLVALNLLDPDLSAAGYADLDLVVVGPKSTPRATGELSLVDGHASYGDLEWADLDVTVRADSDRLLDLELSTTTLGGTVAVTGMVPVLADTVAGVLEFDARDLELTRLLPQDARRPDVSVRTSIAGRFDLSGFDIESVTGSGDVSSLAITAGDFAFGTTGASAWRLDAGELSIPRLRVEGNGAALDLELAYLRLQEGLDARGALRGQVDGGVLNPYLAPQGMRARGEATLDIDVAIDQGELSLSGGGAIRGGRFTSVQPPFSLSDAEVDFELSANEIRVTRLDARSGSGRIRGRGNVDWTDVAQPLIDLSLEAAQLPVEVATGVRTEVSGDLRLANTGGRPLLSGSLQLDRGLMTREFNDNQDALGAQSFALRDPGEQRGMLSEIGLDILISTQRNIHIENSTARLEVGGNVSVRGTVEKPEAGGFLTVVPDGTVDLGANRLRIVSGRVDLTGVPAVRPYLEVQAVARVGATTINVSVEGFTDDLRTGLSSPDNPGLTEGDLASLLVTGRTLENAGEGAVQIPYAWALSTLAGLVHEGLGNLITYGPPPGAGPLILAEEADPTSRLSFGFPVGERLSVTYSIALDSTERRMFILDYRLSRNIWLRAIQENAADFGLGISQRFDFNVWRRPAAAAGERRRNQNIGSVLVEGAPSDLTRRPRVTSGDRFDYWRVRDEATRLRDALRDVGYLNAVVNVETTIEPGESTDTVTVTYEVEAGERMAIEWRGDDPGGAIRRAVQGSWDGRVPEEFLLADATRSTRTHLRARRYYDATVNAFTEQRGTNDAEVRVVVFEVDQGVRGERVDLSFAGNDALTDEQLRQALPATDTPEFFLLLERPSELERGLRLRYAAEGLLDARSQAPGTHFDTSVGILRVEIPVEEGTPTYISAVSLDADLSLDQDVVAGSFGVVAGTRVDFPEITAGQGRLRELYRSEGFTDVGVRSVLERTEEGLVVELFIDEGTRARVGEIRIVGNTRTVDRVIRNELTFTSGDPIRLTEFQRSQGRLYDLGAFRSADVRPDADQQGQPAQDVIVQVVERSDIDVSYGVRYNLIRSEQSISKESEPRASGFELSGRVNMHNPFGRANSLGVALFYQGNYQLFRGTYRMPTFFRRRMVTELIVETKREEFVINDNLPRLESRASGFTFQQTRTLTDNRTDRFSLQWNFRYAKYRADRFDDKGEIRLLDTYRPRFGISLIEDRRDSFANPTRGRFWNVTLQAVPEIWGSDVGYVRLYGQAFFFYPITRSIVWASGYRAGVSSGTEEFLLIDDRFQTGGANSVRGYKQNTLGPAVFFDLPEGNGGWLYTGGQSVAVFNQELRFPIWNIVHGGVFWDAGNVWATTRDFSLGDLRHSVGAGVRLALPFGALRFDYAEPLNPCSLEQLSERPLSACAAEVVRFHFSFGYVF